MSASGWEALVNQLGQVLDHNILFKMIEFLIFEGKKHASYLLFQIAKENFWNLILISKQSHDLP